MEKPIEWTRHALTALAERSLRREWVERAVHEPLWVEPDGLDAEVVRHIIAVPEREGRYLRVALVETLDHYRIVSVFLDRRARPK